MVYLVILDSCIFIAYLCCLGIPGLLCTGIYPNSSFIYLFLFSFRESSILASFIKNYTTDDKLQQFVKESFLNVS